MSVRNLMKMDNCLLCGGEIKEVASNTAVSYCERCAVYQIPQGVYMDPGLNIRCFGKRWSRAASLQDGITTLAAIRKKLETPWPG